MLTVSVTYPGGSDARFDHDYYMTTHIPLVKRLWSDYGLTGVQVLRGTAKPDGSPPDFVTMALISFDSIESFKKAGKAHGREIFADIPNFTNIQAVTQLNEAVG